VTGEQLLASIDHEFDDAIVISFPILLKSVPLVKNGMIFEKIATAEFCSFTDDKEFNIYRKDIVFVKPMSKTVAIMYQRTLQEMYIMSSKESTEEIKHVLEDDQEEQELTKVDIKNLH
jgi:hypothetical protein